MSQWQFTCVDTMKSSRDTCLPSQQINSAAIALDVNLCATMGTTHITVDCFYDYPAYMANWVAAVRVTGKHVWFRGHWNAWEGNNGVPATMTPTQYLTQMATFISSNASLFQPGDIFDPCAEPENGAYWTSTYGANWTTGAPNAGTDDYNTFHRNCKTQNDASFAALGFAAGSIITGVHSVGGFAAQTTTMLYPATVTALGYITTDSYPPGMNSTVPQNVASALTTEYNAITIARPGIPLIIGEMGYSSFAVVDDTTQANVLTAIFAALKNIPNLIGMNYWVGSGSPSFDGTRLFAGTRTGGWTLRPGGQLLAQLYAQQRLGWQRADLMQVTVGGVPVTTVANSLSISQAIGQRSTASFQVLDNTGVLNFLQGQPVAIFAPVAGNMLFGNQSNIETDTTGFTSLSSATLTRDTTQFWQGAASLKVVTPGSVPFEGVSAEMGSSGFQAGMVVTASVYLRGSGIVQVLFRQSGVTNLAASPAITLTTTWTRYSVTATIPPGPVSGLYGLRVITLSAAALTYWLDGLQVEAGSVASEWSGGVGPVPTPYLPFAGVVMSAARSSPGWASTMIHSLACADWHYLADKRIAASTYSNQTIGFMTTDLYNTYLASEGVTIQRGINYFSANQSSIELDTSGFNTVLSTALSRDSSTSVQGSASLKCVTPGSATFEGVVAQVPVTGQFVPGGTVTLSAWMKASTGTPTIRFYCQSNGTNVGTATSITLSTTWTRYTKTITLPNPITQVWLGLRWDTGSVAQALTLWMDGLQFEAGGSASAWELGGLAQSVATGPTVASFLVNYVPVSKAFDDLANLAGYTWQIDANKVLWMLPPTAAVMPSPWVYDGTQGDDTTTSQVLEETNPLYRNAQWILSIKDVTTSQTETKQGDGTATAFTLAYPIHSVPTVTVNGVAQTVGIGQVDPAGTKQWYWNEGSNVLSQDPAGPPLNTVYQTLIASGATAGTFTLSYKGVATANITWNDTAATVQTRLQALTTVGAGNALVTGGPLPGAQLLITFAAALAHDATQVIVGTNALVGGTPTLATVSPLSVTYIGEWTSNVYSQSGGAIVTEQATEGGTGTGIVEEAHSDATITTSGQGFQLAGALLARYAQIGRTLTFTTRTGGLAPQQLLTVNLPPAWGMFGVQALIESITVTTDDVWWLYSVKALVGPVNDTWVQYFQRIANPLGTLPGTAGVQQTVALLQAETAAWNWTAATYTATVTVCPVPSATLFPSPTLFPC